jgi:hypothetical protein
MLCLGGLDFSIWRYIAIAWNEVTEGVWDEATARILSLAFLLPSSKNDAWDAGLL